MKREDGDFIKDLRAEILALQASRLTYVRLKLAFVGGLFAASGFADKGIYSLYLAPVLALVFDLYIQAEDFGVKRAGFFIRESPYAPPSERLWEKLLKDAQDPFVKPAAFLASLLTLVASAVLLGFSQEWAGNQLWGFVAWVGLNSVLILSNELYRRCGWKRLDLFAEQVRSGSKKAKPKK